MWPNALNSTPPDREIKENGKQENDVLTPSIIGEGKT
jgi:hypothetical protein